MLERVPLLEKDLDTYVEFAGQETIDRIRALAEPLRGARILHVNATAYGGGGRGRGPGSVAADRHDVDPPDRGGGRAPRRL